MATKDLEVIPGVEVSMNEYGNLAVWHNDWRGNGKTSNSNPDQVIAVLLFAILAELRGDRHGN